MDKFKIGDIIVSNENIKFSDGTGYFVGQYIHITSYNINYFNLYSDGYTKVKKIPWFDKNGRFKVSSVEMIEKYLQYHTGKKFSVGRHGRKLLINTVLNGELYTTEIYAPYLYTISETDFAQLIAEIENESKNPV